MDLKECIEYMSKWYFADTVELMDLVLDDDIEDPQYSAITTLNRFWIYLQYKKEMDNSYECHNVSSLLKKIGYTSEDIALFRKKIQQERQIYTADILDEEFFKE